MELSFQQKIALYIGELVLEVKNLETLNEQIKKNLFELQSNQNRKQDKEDVYHQNKIQP